MRNFTRIKPPKPVKNLLLVLLPFCCILSASAQTSDEHALQALIQDSFDHIWSELDAEKIPDYYLPDFLLLEHGEVWDNAFIATYFEGARTRSQRPIRTNRFEFIRTDVQGDMAWIAYHNYADFALEGQETRKAYWLESAVALKTPQGWKLKMLHSTRGKVD
ncbi:hypothetical protein ADIS_1450 [Lunatimonas lonarensis]|uniref:DUF4440 domain-containing protein n=1 Tax=Lunatimonas lonarensis TaxID=1232681 RepID=R7ZVD7_9BACT|nr:hypothetical protein ADIS_1450 [Lunatimonas lonarensis]